MALRPQVEAKSTAIAFLREVRAAGWRQVNIDLQPDGSVRVNASMGNEGSSDEFNVPNMRMGRKRPDGDFPNMSMRTGANSGSSAGRAVSRL